MDTPLSKERKALRSTPNLDPKDLFWAMAYDLKVFTDPLVIDAYTLLCNRKYLGFLKTLDTMGSQLYEPVPPSNAGALYQLAGLFFKYPFDDPSIDRDEVALKKFRTSEHKCRRMNQKFRCRRSKVEPPHMDFMRRWIKKVIGISPNYNSIYSKCDFGPGSAVGCHGKNVDFLTKLDTLTITPAAQPVAYAALLHNSHYTNYLVNGRTACLDYDWFASNIDRELVQYNKIVCVPKNAKSNRTIAIEPSLNGFIQKGIDLELRSKLYRIGIDLSKQNLNQALARLGSLDGNYATIDLSSASDSVSIELVRELLPGDWFTLLNTTRSPSYLLNGENYRYEKFCSMGNGFCFPLETLIFSAACEYVMSVCHVPSTSTYNVYGDDIIVPQGCALLLLEVLRDIGFRHNVDKTFIHGDYRESCGADYYLGENIRPLMIKEVTPLNHKCYYILNQLRHRKMMKAWNTLYKSLPKRWSSHVRPYSRDDDTAIDVPLDFFMNSKSAVWSRDLHTWTWTHVISKTTPGRKLKDNVELLAGKLRGDLSRQEIVSEDLSKFSFSARFSERTRIARTC